MLLPRSSAAPTEPTLDPTVAAVRPGELDAGVAFRDDVVVITLAGPLRGRGAEVLDRVRCQLSRRALQAVVIDAARVTAVDRGGLHQLLAVCPPGARLRLRRPSRCLGALLHGARGDGLVVDDRGEGFVELRALAQPRVAGADEPWAGATWRTARRSRASEQRGESAGPSAAGSAGLHRRRGTAPGRGAPWR